MPSAVKNNRHHHHHHYHHHVIIIVIINIIIIIIIIAIIVVIAIIVIIIAIIIIIIIINNIIATTTILAARRYSLVVVGTHSQRTEPAIGRESLLVPHLVADAVDVVRLECLCVNHHAVATTAAKLVDAVIISGASGGVNANVEEVEEAADKLW